MNQGVLFKGKRMDNDEWAESDSIMWLGDRNPKLWCFYDGWVDVFLRSVSQYIGINDRKRKKCFEGDIINIKAGYGISAFTGNAIIFFDEKRLQYRVRSIKPSSFNSEKGDVYDECDFTNIEDFEIIGNRYDNPELLGVKNEKTQRLS